ncbi:hypothetical protein IC235_13275 [Hymenobacter sp. BT664]|uniref:Uncharacterized protein n=1 Tax=Hymenobacter montanus TaxID=2771359 RepID=A0A927BDK0_9BACT|nr:hypothetical protein [Hymenobacter montanus]MBD2768860.1 hypothetical protein [Hymenobacter montanus]
MRKLFAMLAYSIMLCLATLNGAHARTPVPNHKIYATEYVMRPAMCVIDTVATTYAAILKPVLGPVAPASLVAVDSGQGYLALLRSMTCPTDDRRNLVKQVEAV